VTASAHYTMIVFGVLIALLGCASTVQADSVTVYPVQAGLVDDGSCCSTSRICRGGDLAAEVVLVRLGDQHPSVVAAVCVLVHLRACDAVTAPVM
jgi:hypothetical protein